jgi:hypothetical protein
MQPPRGSDSGRWRSSPKTRATKPRLYATARTTRRSCGGFSPGTPRRRSRHFARVFTPARCLARLGRTSIRATAKACHKVAGHDVGAAPKRSDQRAKPFVRVRVGAWSKISKGNLKMKTMPRHAAFAAGARPGSASHALSPSLVRVSRSLSSSSGDVARTTYATSRAHPSARVNFASKNPAID